MFTVKGKSGKVLGQYKTKAEAEHRIAQLAEGAARLKSYRFSGSRSHHLPEGSPRKGRPMTLSQANDIVAYCFQNAGWSQGEAPVVVKTEVPGKWDLSDGNYWETARRSPDELRAQCHRWIESFR